MERFDISLWGEPEGVSGVLSYDEDAVTCRIHFEYGEGTIEAEGPDYFEAFSIVREVLLKKGLVPNCIELVLTSTPPAWDATWGAGLKAYKLRLGHRARTRDLVHIFASGPDIKPVSVQEQQEFFESWVKSL